MLDAAVAGAVPLKYGCQVSHRLFAPQFDIILVDAAVADPHDRARILAPPPGLLSHGVLASLNKCLRSACVLAPAWARPPSAPVECKRLVGPAPASSRPSSRVCRVTTGMPCTRCRALRANLNPSLNPNLNLCTHAGGFLGK